MPSLQAGREGCWRHRDRRVRVLPHEVRENEVMPGLENTYAFWIGLLVVLIVVYLLPTLIGIIRGVQQLALVFLVNLIGAPTGIGWVAALMLAFGPRRLPADLPLYPPPDATQRPARNMDAQSAPARVQATVTVGL